jgi:hypothetical protein
MGLTLRRAYRYEFGLEKKPNPHGLNLGEDSNSHGLTLGDEPTTVGST